MNSHTGAVTATGEVTGVRVRDTTAVRMRRRSQWMYLGLTLLLMATVGAGFWVSYFGALLQGRFNAHPFMHVHAAVFTGWMILLLAQVLLVFTGRVRLHRRLGPFGAAYGVLVLITGIIVTFVAPAMHVRAGRWTLDRAAGFMLLPVGDMLLFAGFFGAAIWWRRHPETHKRLIVSATVALTFAAAARLYETSLPRLLILWLAPIALAMAFDLHARRRVHRVWVVSLVVFAAAFLRVFAMESPQWLVIGRRLLAPFL